MLQNTSSDKYGYVYPVINIHPKATEQIYIHNLSDSKTLDGKGVQVLNPSTSRSTQMTTNGFEGWYNGNKVFWMQEDATKTSRVYADRGVELPTLKMIPLTVQDNNSITRNGIAFVKTGGSS